MRSPRIGPIVFFVAASVGLGAQAQNEPQFRAGVELIQLDVAVLDDNRQPVRGLTAAGLHRPRQRRRDTYPRVHAGRARRAQPLGRGRVGGQRCRRMS